jgi:hypothetical protein
MKSCIKRYAISCLVAVFAFSAIDAYRHPTHDVRIGAILVTAAIWPVTLAIAFGSALGAVVREGA